MKNARFVYYKRETKQWRVNIHALYLWHTAQDYASEQGIFTDLNKLARVIDSSIANVKGKA